jgi:hypothetical protein
MRYIIYASAILAVLLVATIASGHLPQRATASNGQSNDTLNVLTLEQTIDPTALPRQEIPDEVYR